MKHLYDIYVCSNMNNGEIFRQKLVKEFSNFKGKSRKKKDISRLLKAFETIEDIAHEWHEHHRELFSQYDLCDLP